MTHFTFGSGCPCCVPRAGLSRRQFLCTTAAATAAAPAMASRPILLKGGCVLSLDKAVGDFERADVLSLAHWIWRSTVAPPLLTL